MPKHTDAAAIGMRRAWLGVGAPIIALVGMTIALAVAVFASFAEDQNRAFERNSATLVNSGLEGRARMMGALGLDYANWDAAFQNISVRWDGQWVEGNFYSSVSDAMVLFRQNGAVRHSWASDAFSAQQDELAAAVARAGADIPNLRRLARAPAVADSVAYTYARLGPNLLIIAVAPVTREDDDVRIAYNPLRGYDYLAVVKVIDEEGFLRAGQSMSLQGFHFASADYAPTSNSVALPVMAPDGAQIGNLVWQNARPGSVAFQQRIWPVIFGLLCIGAFTVVITRHLVARQVRAMAGVETALEAARAKAEFLAKVGHELRTPLDGIIGYAEIIEEESDDSTTRVDAGRIITAARYLNDLLTGILDQSHLDAGRMKINRAVLPVAGMVAEVQGLMRPSARTAGVAFTAQLSAAANYVVADHVRLRQCLLNLVGNAIKYSPRGSVTMRTRVVERDGGEFIAFDIVDDGIGIDKVDQDNIFKPFSQANQQVADTYGGTGLGLSIARDLARAMGGDIIFVSELGQGATFTLFVPIASSRALEAA